MVISIGALPIIGGKSSVGHNGPHDFAKRSRAVGYGHDVPDLHRFDARMSPAVGL